MFNRADSTSSPIPIGLHPFVTALHPEHVFKVLNVISVSWEEESSKVNPFIG